MLRTAPGAAWILSEFAARFHRDIESLTGGQLDDWSYAWRTVRGTATHLSCHASGTAIDLNALKHPRGVRGTFSRAEKQRLRILLDDFTDFKTGAVVIKWGGDFNAPSIVDEMHFQIRGDQDALDRVKERLLKKPPEDTLPSVEDVWNAKFKEYGDYDKDGDQETYAARVVLMKLFSAVNRIELAVRRLEAPAEEVPPP
jgi:hypothetical protein